MINNDNLKELQKINYVRRASHLKDYWFDFTEKKLNEEYINQFNENFNLIIYSKLGDREHYYILPYRIFKVVFSKEYLEKGKRSNRWIGSINNHILRVSHCPHRINIQKYYATPIELSNQMVSVMENDKRYEELFSTAMQDIEAYDNEVLKGTEGEKKAKMVNYFERDPKLRASAIRIHGLECVGCGFNFEKVYGAHGKDYIEVHHLIPLYSLDEVAEFDATHDFTVVCSNCHRMIHRKKENPLSIQELQEMVKKNRGNIS